MIAFLTASLLLVSGVSATYADAASEVYSAASVLDGKVKGWSSADGVQGALAIQGEFPNLSSALSVLSNAVISAKAADIDVEGTNHSLNVLSSLLQALTEKATDFASVSLTSIVINDLKDVNRPAKDIVNSLIEVSGEDSSKWDNISKGIFDIESKINDANKAYGLSEIQFKSAASGGSGSAASSSEHSEQSSAIQESQSSSSAGSSGPSSRAASASASKSCAHKSGAAQATTARNTTNNATESHSPEGTSHSIPAVKNGGALATVGACGVAVGVVAMLL